MHQLFTSVWFWVIVSILAIIVLLILIALIRINQFTGVSKKKKDKIRFCPKCHNQIWESSSICPKCGKKLK